MDPRDNSELTFMCMFLFEITRRMKRLFKVERVIPAEESNGRVQIFAGSGMCPGGNRHLYL